MTRKRARTAATRPRDARGRFLSKASIAAVKGWQTRARKARAATRATRERVRASRHGEKARIASERKLTAAQRAARTRDARRIAAKERRAKKAPRETEAPRGLFSRSTNSPRLKDRSKKSTPKPRRSTDIQIGRGDKFAAQITARFDMPAGFKPSAALVREAIRYRVEHGEDAPRVHLKIKRWRNPGRRHSEDRAWRQGNQADAWMTLGKVIAAAIAE